MPPCRVGGGVMAIGGEEIKPKESLGKALGSLLEKTTDAANEDLALALHLRSILLGPQTEPEQPKQETEPFDEQGLMRIMICNVRTLKKIIAKTHLVLEDLVHEI